MALIERDSLFGMEMMHTPVMINRLNAAEPTIVPGPRSPASNLFERIT